MTRENSKRNSGLSRTPLDVSTMVYGKVPPQAKDLEEAVLGAILLEKDAFDTVSELLSEECFYIDAHQRIFKAMKSLDAKNQPIDYFTLIEELRSSEELDIIGGSYYITKLTNNVVSSANIEAHMNKVYEKYLLREQIRICGDAVMEAYEDSSNGFETVDQLSQNINLLSEKTYKQSGKDLSELLVDRFKRLAELKDRPDHLTGVPTGFRELDLITAGWQDTDLIIIAARPSVGKTAFALNLARNAAASFTKPTPVGIFSLEMSSGQLVDRLMSSESGISLDLITRAKVTDSDLNMVYNQGVQKLAGYAIKIDDTPALNILQLRAKARNYKKKYNIGLIIIDYLQLMSGLEGRGKSNREQEISTVSRGLKALAKELHIPVIALSQLSREVEKRAGGEPQLSDLRESGAIEQDADMVLFLTRPDYQQTDMSQEFVTDMADIHIKKHRNGSLAKIPMRTVLSIQRWMSQHQYDQYQMNLKGFRKVIEEDPF
jgi:replicative DNA helicase